MRNLQIQITEIDNGWLVASSGNKDGSGEGKTPPSVVFCNGKSQVVDELEKILPPSPLEVE